MFPPARSWQAIPRGCSATVTDLERACETARALDCWGTARAWSGSDPYDALNARRFPRALTSSARARQALIQVVKRSPLDLRPALRVPREPDAATFAFLASAYARGGFLESPELEIKRLRESLATLESLRVPDADEPCWGYHFPVQTRIFFYPRGAPNTIATAFAGLAFLDAYERVDDDRLLDFAAGTAAFFRRRVPQTAADEGAYFGYLAGDRTPIHNANMLVCILLARVHAHTGEEALLTAAEEGVRYTVAHQRPDGSWPYAERRGWDWVDGYHTGYVLDALSGCVALGVSTASHAALERGFAFYRNRLFLSDGTPRFTAASTYPVDAACVAQGIQTPTVVSTHLHDARDLAWRVFDFARRRMRRSDGAFMYQRGRFLPIATPHMRWTQAPMLLALAHLLQTKDGH